MKKHNNSLKTSTESSELSATTVSTESRRNKKGGKPSWTKADDRSRKPYCGPNDINWRTRSALAPLAGNLPFGYPSGLQFENILLPRPNGGTQPSTVGLVAGILSIRVLLTAGRASDYNAGCNLAFRKIYSFIRHANSGSKNYEAVDLGMYFISYGQALGMLGFLQRVYRLICKFSSTNRYTPKDLVDVQGVDYDDLRQHQAELAYLIRWMGSSLNGLAVPKMSYFDACYQAFINVYEDRTSPKQQFYMISPAGFGIYNPTYTAAGGGVEFSSTYSLPTINATTKWTVSDIYSKVHGLMDVLLSDEDIGIMSGDILKAYGEGGLYKAQSTVDSPLEFIESQEILQQVHNVSYMPTSLMLFDGYEQDPGATNTAPFAKAKFSANGAFSSITDNGRLEGIDTFSHVPDYKEIFNCCVLKTSGRFKYVSTSQQYVVDDKTILFNLYYVQSMDLVIGAGNARKYMPYNGHLTGFATCWTISQNNLATSGLFPLSHFDWAPLAYYTDANFSNSLLPLGDVQNINFFSDSVLTRIHDASILSLFDFIE